MEYKGHTISLIEDKLISINNITDFNPIHIFECGQCFRWHKQEDGSYTGVVRGKVINILYKQDNTLFIKNASVEDFVNIWYDYLDLGRDYSKIKIMLSEKDSIMKEAVEFGYGIRLLKQEFWETLISFVISANNRIPMIMKVVAAISKAFGEEIFFEGKEYYTFPTVGNLANTCVEQLAVCKAGFRCKYIDGTSKMLNEIALKPSELHEMNSYKAREQLKRFPGVGDKVADCTLLYSGIKYDVFPTDVWVKRVMEELYFHREASLKEIQEFAANYFGEFAGFAQQYLFYYARENKIGARP